MACKTQLRLKASAVLNSPRNFNIAREKRLLKGAYGIEVKKCEPRGGGGYSDIFEQHRLSLFFGVQIQINIF